MSAYQPTRQSPRRQLVTALGVASLVAYVGIVEPHSERVLLPRCPTHLLTGLNCPACGGLRMTHDLLRGDLVTAAHDNFLLLVSVPLFLLWVTRCITLRAFSTPDVLRSPKFLVAAGVVVLGWTVVRNIPGFPLAPIT